MKKILSLALACLFALILSASVSAMRVDESINIEYAGYYNSYTSTYAARTLAGDDLFPDDFNTGDWVVFGIQTEYWRDLSLSIDAGIAADSVSGVWEFPRYRNGDYWVSTGDGLVDGTSGLSASGSVDFNLWDVSTWGYSANAGGKIFPVRYRITAVDTPTEGGSFDATPTAKDCTAYVENGDSVTIEELHDYVRDNATSQFIKRPINDNQFGYGGTHSIYAIYGKIEIESGGTLDTSNSVIELSGVGYVQAPNRNWVWCKTGGTWNWGNEHATQEYGENGGFLGCTPMGHANDLGLIKIEGTANWYGVSVGRLGLVPNFVLTGTLNAEDVYFDLYYTSMAGWDFTKINSKYGLYLKNMKDAYGAAMNVEYSTPARNIYFYNMAGFLEVDSGEAALGYSAVSRFEDCEIRKALFLNGYQGDAAPLIQWVDGEIWDGVSSALDKNGSVIYRIYDGWRFDRLITINHVCAVDEDSNPLQGVDVNGYYVSGQKAFSARTDANGCIPSQEVMSYNFDNDTGVMKIYYAGDENSWMPIRIDFEKDGYIELEEYIDTNSGNYFFGNAVMKESPEVFVKIAGGTEYNRGETARIVALVTGKDGVFLADADADCNAAIFNPSNDWNGGGAMAYLTNGTFYYNHALTLDAPHGVWIATVDCNTSAADNNLAYDSHAFHVASWITDLNSSISSSVDNNAIAQTVWNWSGDINDLILNAIANAVWTFVSDVGRWVHGFI